MSVDQVLLITAARAHATNGTGRRIRERARLSLQDVGAAIGSSGAAVSRWERGERMPRGTQAIKWAELLTELDKATRRQPGRR